MTKVKDDAPELYCPEAHLLFSSGGIAINANLEVWEVGKRGGSMGSCVATVSDLTPDERRALAKLATALWQRFAEYDPSVDDLPVKVLRVPTDRELERIFEQRQRAGRPAAG